MIAPAAASLLVAVGLLVTGLVTGSTTVQWLSFAASALAAAILVAGELRRRRSPGRPGGRRHEARTGRPRPSLPMDSPAAVPTQFPVQPPTRIADAAPGHAASAAAPPGEPPVEEVELTDLLVVLDLRDEVLVVDEHPRYHLAGCARPAGRPVIPMPMDQARAAGFTPCGACTPDRHLAQLERFRRGVG